MTLRKTSLIAWRELQESGLLTGMRELVAKCVYDHGPMTHNELDSRLKGHKEINPSYHKRLSELGRMGVIERVGERACSITGNLCELWDISGRPPKKLEASRTVPSAKDFDAALSELHQINVALGGQFSPELVRVCTWMKRRGSRQVQVPKRRPRAL